jgi:hypothetical protein
MMDEVTKEQIRHLTLSYGAQTQRAWKAYEASRNRQDREFIDANKTAQKALDLLDKVLETA